MLLVISSFLVAELTIFEVMLVCSCTMTEIIASFHLLLLGILALKFKNDLQLVSKTKQVNGKK